MSAATFGDPVPVYQPPPHKPRVVRHHSFEERTLHDLDQAINAFLVELHAKPGRWLHGPIQYLVDGQGAWFYAFLTWQEQ